MNCRCLAGPSSLHKGNLILHQPPLEPPLSRTWSTSPSSTLAAQVLQAPARQL